MSDTTPLEDRTTQYYERRAERETSKSETASADKAANWSLILLITGIAALAMLLVGSGWNMPGIAFTVLQGLIAIGFFVGGDLAVKTLY